MNIRKDLPFECCESCEDFVLHVERLNLYTMGFTTVELIIECKNESLCRRLNEKKVRCSNECRD